MSEVSVKVLSRPLYVALKAMIDIIKTFRGHGVIGSNILIPKLEEAGFTCERKEEKGEWDDDDEVSNFYIVTLGKYRTELYGSTFEEQLVQFKYSGRPFVIIRPDAERAVEYFDMDTDESFTEFDDNGNPPKGVSLYAVVKDENQVPFYAGYLWDRPEERGQIIFNEGDLLYKFAREFAGITSGAGGKGFAGDENMRIIHEALENNKSWDAIIEGEQ